MHVKRKSCWLSGAANPHVYILLINPDYQFLIGLLRLPWNEVTLPNKLNLQLAIGTLFLSWDIFSFPCRSRAGASSLSVACGLSPR